MTQATRPDTWDKSSRTLLTIKSKAGVARHFRTSIVSTDKSGGTKDFDVIYNYAEGCLKKHGDVTPVELTFEGYATEVGTETAGTEGLGFDDLMNTADASQPLSISLDNTRTDYCVVFEKTTSTSATDAMAATATGDRAIRSTFKNGNFTDVASSDTDGVLKYTLKYKVAPFQRDGTANVIFESSDGTGTVVLPVITYT